MSAANLSAVTFLRRTWRGGDLSLILVSVILAVAVVVGIGIFVDKLETALDAESKRFLAADVVVSSSRELPDSWRQAADDLGLAQAETVNFLSMVFNDQDDMLLSAVKAVSDRYPLRGELGVSDSPFGEIGAPDGVPTPGTVWVAPRLLSALSVSVGDGVWVGESKLKIARVVRSEPDAASGAFSIGPRVMMNVADLPATQVIQPGSRIDYRLLLAGDSTALQVIQGELKPQLEQGQRLLSLDENQPRIGRAIARAKIFLMLAGSLALILAAAAMAMAARRYAGQNARPIAVMKSLGARSDQISWMYARVLSIIAVFGFAGGAAIGWALQAGFIAAFAEQLPVQLGNASPLPVLFGAIVASGSVGSFAWPSMRNLAQVSPLLVLRKDIALATGGELFFYLFGIALVFALIAANSGDLTLTAGLLGGIAAVAVVGVFLSLVLLRVGRGLGMRAGSVWRLALANLQRRALGNAVQGSIFGVAVMLMLLMVITRTSLVDQWKAQVPEGTPNHFVLNIAPEEVAAFNAFLNDNAVSSEQLYPMTRGRVMAVNGEPLAGIDEEGDAPQQREANFTWSDTLPAENTLVEGEWWSAGTEDALVSLEQRFAESLNAKIGDRLTFRIAADEFEATVSSIRSLNWQSMKPNFFVVFPKPVLAAYPGLFMTSLYLPKEKKLLLNDLAKTHRTFTIIELDIILDELRAVVNNVSKAVEIVLAVILVSGSLVLFAGVRSTVGERLREAALLRAMGGRQSLVRGALWIEFGALGSLAGLLAIVGAETASWLLQSRVLNLDYAASPVLWIPVVLLSAAVIGVLGVWTCREAVAAPPLNVLREAS